MKNIFKISIIGLLISIGCNSKPEVIQPTTTSANISQANTDAQVLDPKTQVHEILVQDVMQSTRYTYLSVTEDAEPFWIAVPKSEVEKGKTYYYQGGLLMKNFESVDFNRVFETIYLVSGLSNLPILRGQESIDNLLNNSQNSNTTDISAANLEKATGGINLKELFEEKEKYAGQIVKIKGQCVKVNKNIMGKNWIHIQDGSDADQELDLTITTDDNISVGDVIIIEGIITLNKDFGAGYRYDIIMEDAQMIL